MAKTTLWLVNEKAPDLSKALTVLLRSSAEYALKEPPHIDNSDKPHPIGIIPWFSLRDGAFASDLCALWEEDCRRFVLVAPSSEHPLPWAGFPAHLRTAFDVAIRTCKTPSWEELQKPLNETKSIQPWATHRVQEYVEARMLYIDLLSIFSHGSNTDLTNQFLAPARILLNEYSRPTKAITAAWRDVWQKFNETVLIKIVNDDFGLLGQELRQAGEHITKALKDKEGLPDPRDLEALMSLLTRIRSCAGVSDILWALR